MCGSGSRPEWVGVTHSRRKFDRVAFFILKNKQFSNHFRKLELLLGAMPVFCFPFLFFFFLAVLVVDVIVVLVCVRVCVWVG